MGATNHFWVGSLCYLLEHNKPVFPRNVISVMDTITLDKDIENRIPDKSWMLYLLELFSRENIPAELNLICQFNERNNFWAIFEGINRYKFTKVLPVVGHSYLRQIIIDREKNSIMYCVMDNNSREVESFDFALGGKMHYPFEGANHFTGIEWWNKSGSSPFQIRYRSTTSGLFFGCPDTDDTITYRPYNVLVPNGDGSRTGYYPVSFSDVVVKENAISYTVDDGLCKSGMKLSYPYSSI